MNTWPNRGASGGPCGGLGERERERERENLNPKLSDHGGLTQANRPPRNPVRFRETKRSMVQPDPCAVHLATAKQLEL